MERQKLQGTDLLPLILLMALALTAGIIIATSVTEQIPHLEDEIAYLFQARIFARGKLWASPPVSTSSFYIPFALIINEKWIAKYTIGWPMLLAVGERFSAGWLVNPVLGALTTGMTYLIGREIFDRGVAITAAVLCAASPFFLIQSGTLMSHMFSAFCVACLTLAYLRLARIPSRSRRLAWASVAGISLGFLWLTRPLTGLAILIPFVILFARLLWQNPRQAAPDIGILIVIAALIAALQPIYLYMVTGSLTTNLYTLVWPYDRVGFGPGYGPYEGHTLQQALRTAGQDLELWSSELLGLPYVSWLPVIAGTAALLARRKEKAQSPIFLLAGPFVALVGVYLIYWVGAQVYGPRYYFEGHTGLMILAAVGLQAAGDIGLKCWNRLRKHTGSQLLAQQISHYLPLALVLAISSSVYLPNRIDDWQGLYGITRAPLEQLETIRGENEVLLFVRGSRWIDYAALFSENTPWLDGPVLAAHDMNEGMTSYIQSQFPEREAWFYRDGMFTQTPTPYD